LRRPRFLDNLFFFAPQFDATQELRENWPSPPDTRLPPFFSPLTNSACLFLSPDASLSASLKVAGLIFTPIYSDFCPLLSFHFLGYLYFGVVLEGSFFFGEDRLERFFPGVLDGSIFFFSHSVSMSPDEAFDSVSQSEPLGMANFRYALPLSLEFFFKSPLLNLFSLSSAGVQLPGGVPRMDFPTCRLFFLS